MKTRVLTSFFIGIFFLAACGSPPVDPVEAPPVQEKPAEPTKASEPAEAPALSEGEVPPESVEEPVPFELKSTAFAQGEPIPVKYSCDGEDISPPLAWGRPPAGTQSQVLIMDDPDAPVGTWDHWIVFNIAANTYGLEEGLPITGINQIPGWISVAKNSWGRNDYGGPCPPGGTHRYFFKLYALGTTLNLDENADKKQVQSAMEGHILAETELMGTYSR